MGSAAYVRTHREEVSQNGRLMYNLDAYGSPLGWLQLHVNAHPDFEASFRPHFRAANLYYQTITSVVPYADHFPFAAAGLPGGVPLPGELQRRPLLPPSARRRPEPRVGGGRGARRRRSSPRGSTRWRPPRRCPSRLASPRTIERPSRRAGRTCSADGRARSICHRPPSRDDRASWWARPASPR